MFLTEMPPVTDTSTQIFETHNMAATVTLLPEATTQFSSLDPSESDSLQEDIFLLSPRLAINGKARKSTYIMHQQHGIQDSLFYILGVSGAAISVLGIACNVIILMVYTRRRASKRNSSVLFMALSVFDLVYLLFFVVFGALQVIVFKVEQETTMAAEAEEYVDGVSNVVVTGSVFVTAALTVERWLAVSKPLKWTLICSKRHSNIVVLLLSSAAVLVNLPLFFEDMHHRSVEHGLRMENCSCPQNNSAEIFVSQGFQAMGVGPAQNNSLEMTTLQNTTCGGDEICEPTLVMSVSQDRWTWYVKFILPFFQVVVPGTVIIVSTFFIIFSIRHHRVGVAAMDRDSNQSNSMVHKSANRISVQVVIMAAVTLISNGMMASSYVVTALDGTVFINECSQFCIVYVSFSHIAVAVNSSINFPLYCYFSKWFRADVKKILTRKACVCTKNAVTPSFTQNSGFVHT